MRSLSYLFVLALIGLFVCSSCKDESTFEEPIIDETQAYFPIGIGKSITYQVDSIIYDPTENSVEVDTNRVYIQEVVVDTFRDEVGALIYRIERYQSSDSNFNWEIKDVWSASKSTTRAERFEENLRFVKMVFPVEDGDIWDGNVFIDETTLFSIAGESIEIFKSWFYEVLSTDESEEIGGFFFEHVTTISQADEENLIELRRSVEKYAKGVGLVYREMEVYDTQTIDETVSWDDKADKGFKLVMVVVDYN